MAVMPSIVEPAALVAGAREDFVNRLPEPKSTVPDSHFGGDSQSTGLDVYEQFPPTLRTLADAHMEAKQLVWRENAAPQRFLIRRTALGRRPDDHQNALGLILR